MNPDYLDLAEQLADQLLAITDIEARCIALGSALKVIAESVDHTDAYEPLTTTATDIAYQATLNFRRALEDKEADISYLHREAFRREISRYCEVLGRFTSAKVPA